MPMNEFPATIQMFATCKGGINPERYPRLVHEPDKWGLGIRCESNGTHIDDVAAAIRNGVDPVASLGITQHEYGDAVLYCKDNELI